MADMLAALKNIAACFNETAELCETAPNQIVHALEAVDAAIVDGQSQIDEADAFIAELILGGAMKFAWPPGSCRSTALANWERRCVQRDAGDIPPTINPQNSR